ncbi:hypothetical protein O181_128007 [Austropuccinia psidii MF-1]|uniref:Uncharacterized protein n=1 Tax=Austropuccinia psidii MF-1 TaxID=1389203 RepID=A0A9Q3QA18_9BASI|nr:hypothetical protein [Austropuccinia psidii MF-1]
MAKSLKRHFLTSEAFQNPNFIHILLKSPQKTFGPFQHSITKSAIYGVIHHYASFFSSNPMVISTFQQVIKAHPPEDFSVFLQGNTGCSFPRDIQEAVPKQCVKGKCSTNPPWQPNSFSKVLIHQHLYYSFINHGKIIQPSSFPNLARYTLHQSVNTASRIQ